MSQRVSEDRASKDLDQTIPSDNNSPQYTQNLLSFTPVPATRASLPIRGANPGDPFAGREVVDISVDNLLIRESDLNLNTSNLLLNVTKQLKEVDKSIIEFTNNTSRNMDGNSEPTVSSKQPSNTQQPKTQKSVQQVPNRQCLITLDQKNLLIYCQNHVMEGTDIEQLDIFLENCKFAVSYVQEPSKTRLLQAIMTRLNGKACQVSRNRTFYTWETLREFLKANLEPQRTTQHLHLELYSSKQKENEDILSTSMRIEELQTLLIE
ncbi:hypothetical protein QTP88_022418 [Uroleucon formosanum]